MSKLQPGVIFESLKLICPICETVLTTDECSNCGQKIDIKSFDIDVQPSEILQCKGED